MSNLVRWNPARDMMTVSDAMNRLLDEAFIFPRNGGFGATIPSIDLVEQGDNIVVTAELPGFTPENVDIRVEGNTLSLRGEVKQENEKTEGQYHVKERHQSSFNRTVTLPVAVKADKAVAEFDNGVLKLTLPKAEEAKPKRISITARNGK